MRALRMGARACGFVRAITPTFMHGFQNYLALFLSFRRKSAILGKLKVKSTLEGHINKLVRAITPTFMHGFQNNMAQLFSLRSSSPI